MTLPPGAEPTLWELHRTMAQLREDQRGGIAQLRDDLRADIASLAARLDQVVTEEVYRADQRTVLQRLEILERDLAAAQRHREDDQAQQTTNRRLIISAFVAPLVVYALQLWQASRGAGLQEAGRQLEERHHRFRRGGEGSTRPMTVRGVDVASYQATDYSIRGLDFAFIKITEGTTYTNPKWVAERKTARDAGLVTGFYHFIRPGNVTKQADYFLSKITLRAGDILALDWEDPGVTCAQKDAWIRYVQKKTPGHRVILYCNYDYWTNRDTTSFAGDGLWIARYNGKPGQPGIKAAWRFHQYTSTPIDTNVGNFTDKAALRTWAGASSSATGSAPKPTPPKPAYVPPAVPGRARPRQEQAVCDGPAEGAAGIWVSDDHRRRSIGELRASHPGRRRQVPRKVPAVQGQGRQA